jgi:ABC-type nickel/cobalt efflux system permease component RcnA
LTVLNNAARLRTRLARTLQRSFSTFFAVGLLLFPTYAFAHPMGNFSISHYSGISIGRGLLEVHYFIDMAEIPTFQEMQQNGMEARPDEPRLPEYLFSKAAAFANGLHVTLNGRALPLRIASQDVIFPTGAGNLPTMKFGFAYQAEIPVECAPAPCHLDYEDVNFPNRAGWKEVVVAAGQGTSLVSSTAPDRDRSGQLSNYPTDLLNSPPQVLEASLVFSTVGLQANAPATTNAATGSRSPAPRLGQRTGGNGTKATPTLVKASSETVPSADADIAIRVKPNQQATPRNAFTELIATKQLGFGITLLAAVVAAGLGALHALEPGHGKTIVAAYLVGSKGTARHALLLGMVVTVSHTAGVYLLGGITLYAQKYILPDRIYPFLGVLSGILIAGTGCFLFLQRYIGGEFAHSHAPANSASAPVQAPENPGRRTGISARQLLVLGVTGGMVPCPAALVVLLSAVALHRTAFGLYLIVAFSIGLAAVLIAMGFVAVCAGRTMSRLPFEAPLIQRWLPMASALMISVLGCGIAVRGLMAAGIVHFRM